MLFCSDGGRFERRCQSHGDETLKEGFSQQERSALIIPLVMHEGADGDLELSDPLGI